MNKLNKEVNDVETQALKAQIGFGTAFKATLGFYAAKTLAALIQLAIFGLVGLVILGILYFIFR